MNIPRADFFEPPIFELSRISDREANLWQARLAQTLLLPLGSGLVKAALYWNRTNDGGIIEIDSTKARVPVGSPEESALHMLEERIAELISWPAPQGLSIEEAGALAAEFQAIATGGMGY
jgi:hypothetical protein